jgi:hypothetical protein
MPADGIGAAVKKQDFGTSRWQLADNLNVRDRSVHHYPYCRKGNAARSLGMMPGPLATGVMSGSGTKRTCLSRRQRSALVGIADMAHSVFYEDTH